MNRSVFETGLIMGLAALVLAVFNSASLQTWTFDLEPGPVSDQIGLAAEWWHLQMVELGAADVTQAIRDRFSSLTGAF